jgi:hypothetical protein
MSTNNNGSDAAAKTAEVAARNNRTGRQAPSSRIEDTDAFKAAVAAQVAEQVKAQVAAQVAAELAKRPQTHAQGYRQWATKEITPKMELFAKWIETEFSDLYNAEKPVDRRLLTIVNKSYTSFQRSEMNTNPATGKRW